MSEGVRFARVVRRLPGVFAVLACLAAWGCNHGASMLTVSISSPPSSPKIEEGQSVTMITALVANDSAADGVNWTLSGIGTLSNQTTTTVTYIAPALVNAVTTVNVTATSIANPVQSAALPIVVTPAILVAISPRTPSVPALGGTQNFTATVTSDENSAGVSWSLSGVNCSGATCGTLTNVTTTSVTYTAPPSQPSPSDTVTLTATSIADSTRASTAIITVLPPRALSVAITNKIAAAGVGSAAIVFNAVVTSDPSNSGVTWGIAANGSNCQPACGTLSSATATSVTYTPPSALAASPNNQPTLTATSVAAGTQSDTDTFLIQVVSTNACTGAPTGNESLLNGEYSFLVQGFQGSGSGTPVAIAAGFGVNGSTHAITGGDLDINGVAGAQHLTINSTGSLYTVGLDSTGAGNLGCVSLATSSGAAMTFRFALGGVTAGVASQGRIIEFDDGSGTGTIASGILRIQTSASFSASALQPNYAFGLDGVDSQGGAASVAGSFSVATTGSITSGFADVDDAGAISAALTGGSGAIAGISVATGRGTAIFSIAGVSYHWAIYMINADEFFIVETDPLASGSFISSGRAVVTANSFSSASLSGNYIVHTAGIASCNALPCAEVNLDLLTFGGGVVNGSLFNYEFFQGPETLALSGGAYTVSSPSGRVTLSAIGFALPVMYLASPSTDGISAFVVGQGITGEFGLAEFQPSRTYSAAALAGNYIVGSEDPRDNDVTNEVGVIGIAAPGGNSPAADIVGTVDRSGQTGLQNAVVVGGNVTITNLTGANITDGTGTIWVPNSVAITNGTRIFYVDESAGRAVIDIVDPQ